MGQHFLTTLQVAEQLELSRQYILRMAKLANLDLDTVGDYKAWSPKNIQLVSEVCHKSIAVVSDATKAGASQQIVSAKTQPPHSPSPASLRRQAAERGRTAPVRPAFAPAGSFAK